MKQITVTLASEPCMMIDVVVADYIPAPKGGIYRISESAWCFLAVDTAFWLFCSISPAPVGI